MFRLITKCYEHPNVIKNVRALCSVKENNSEYKKSNFVTIYKFPYIRPFSIVNRLKFYQTVLTGITVPCCLTLSMLNYVSFELVQIVTALGISGCISFYGLGHLVVKFIGFIYYDEEQQILKVAYVDFWGRRKDIEMPVSDVIPRTELPTSLTDGLFLKFRRYSNKETLKYSLRYGIITDIEKMNKVL